jgi:hypothetical protein
MNDFAGSLASGATAVQIVWSSRRGSRNIEHIGSAYDDAELEALKAAARQRLAAGQLELDLGPAGPGPSGPLEIASSRMGYLLDALGRAYDALGFPRATEGDEVFRPLVLARIIEAASKQDSLRVLEEAAFPRRRIPRPTGPAGLGGGIMAAGAVGGLRRARPAGPGGAGPLRRVRSVLRGRPGDGFREPGFSKERLLEPVKRSRFIALGGAVKGVNREPEAGARDLAGRYRTVQIRAGQHILTAEDPLPPGLRGILALIK